MPNETTEAKKPVVVRCAFCETVNRVDLARLGDRPKCAKCGRPMLLDRPQKVTDADFQRIVDGSSVPVVVDFYADWCGPCHAMAPILDEFAASRLGEVLVLKLDTEASPATAGRFAIRGLPTVVSFRGGQELRRHVGLASREVLEGLVA